MYDEYIMEHRQNVLKGFDWMRTNLNTLVDEQIWSLAEYRCSSMHDYSKESEAEYNAYDKYFYARGGRSYQDVRNFQYAWLHHIHNNPHHWQYWVLMNDDEKEGVVCLDMPDEYIIEMICDWWSFSWKKGNLMEIFDWYEERKRYIQLSDATRKKVEVILNLIKASLNELKNAHLGHINPMDPLQRD